MHPNFAHASWSNVITRFGDPYENEFAYSPSGWTLQVAAGVHSSNFGRFSNFSKGSTSLATWHVVPFEMCCPAAPRNHVLLWPTGLYKENATQMFNQIRTRDDLSVVGVIYTLHAYRYQHSPSGYGEDLQESLEHNSNL